MIRRTRHEWESLAITSDGAGDTITRACADGLVAAAQASFLGGSEGEAILVNGHRTLRTQQVVGVLTTPAATLEILPKIDRLSDEGIRRNLVHMLARVLDIDVADAGLTNLSWQHEDLLEVLIRLFCDRLFEAVHRGLPRRYVGAEEDLPRLRGGLDVVRQFTVLAAAPQRLACRFDELSPDIALNQVMKAAVLRLSKLSRASSNQRRLAELGYAFADVSQVPISALRWDQIVLDRTNMSWRTLLELAQLLLGQRFQTTTSGAGQGFALLFEMNTLFEEYIGRALQRALRPMGLDVRLQRPVSHALVSEGGQPRFATRPDVVVFSGLEPLLIVDTKWKQLKGAFDDPRFGVSQSDVYQMMAYSQVYRCPRVLLLYPHHDGIGGSEGRLSSHRINGTVDSQVIFSTVDLADLRTVEARLASMVESALAAPVAA